MGSDNIFSKIIKFFRNLFLSKDDTKLLEEAPVKDIADSQFANIIKIKEDVIANDTILELQAELECNMITIDDLSDEEKESIRELYRREQAELDIKIMESKMKLKSLNDKLNLYYKMAISYHESQN